MEIFFKHILPILGLIVMVGVPFVYVLLTGSFSKGVKLTWILMIVWYAILSYPVYHIVLQKHKQLCIETLPESNSVVASVFLGWLYGLIISGMALLVRGLILKFKPCLFGAKDKETAKEEDRAEGPKVN